MEKVIVQVQFSITDTDGTVFSDALNFSQEDYDATTPEQVEAMKQQRFANWKEFVAKQSAPKTDEELKAELEANISALEEQKAELESQLAALNL